MYVRIEKTAVLSQQGRAWQSADRLIKTWAKWAISNSPLLAILYEYEAKFKIYEVKLFQYFKEREIIFLPLSEDFRLQK